MTIGIVLYVIVWAAFGARFWRRCWGSDPVTTRRDLAECVVISFFWPVTLPVVMAAVIATSDGWSRWWNTPIGRKGDR